jgi:hypothetical protein
MARSSKRFVCFVLAALGCETPTPDPPPKASPTEIPVAPPNAVGALAAGTEGAPKNLPQTGPLGPTPLPPDFEPGEPLPSPSFAPPSASSGAESVPL